MYRWALLLVFTALLGGCCSPPSPDSPGTEAPPHPTADAAASAVPSGVPERVVPEIVAPDPVVPKPVAIPSLTDEELTVFGQELLAALAAGSAERYKFSLQDVDTVFAPAYASIVQTGRAAWMTKIETQLAGKAVVFRSAARGPQFHLGRTGGSGSFRQDIPVASDLRIELLVNGNPHTVTVGAMYLVDGQWKIFRADIAE